MKEQHTLYTIFGATGDLAARKLLPALYSLEKDRLLDDSCKIILIARKQKTQEEYKREAELSIMKFSRHKINEDILKKLIHRMHYFSIDFKDKNHYTDLKENIEAITSQDYASTKRIFYLAIPPDIFETVVNNIHASSLSKSKEGGSTRVVFEKPFGEDLTSAKKLNKAITRVFSEDQIYRIDHYLAKELVQNLLVLRFGNLIFEPLWNKEYIDHVQITVAETLGIENRAGYYDKSGSLRDVVQNHILQLLCLVAMSNPKSLNAKDIKDAKVKVLKTVAKAKDILSTSVKGQYINSTVNDKHILGYRDEANIPKDSIIDTYFAIKLFVHGSQWKSVPFYVRTGKRLKERSTEIVIVYKDSLSKLFHERGHQLESNRLIVRVQPDEGISFQFNAKVPGNKILIEPVNMDFCHECIFGPNSPEAYEKLLHDVMIGDQTLFTRWDEVEYSWKIIDQIAKPWNGKTPFFYPAGSWGPKEADELIKKDGREWVIPKKPYYSQLLGK